MMQANYQKCLICICIYQEYNIALKYHHFRKHMDNGTVCINVIRTKEHVADIFMKALVGDQFVYL